MLTKQRAKQVASSHKQRAKNKYGRTQHFTGDEWYQLCTKHGFRCVICGVKPDHLSPDHMLPLVKGGSNTIDNIMPTCLPCNLRKHTQVYIWTPNTRKVRRPSRRYIKRMREESPKQEENPLDHLGLVFFGVWAIWPLLLLGMSILGFDDETLLMVALLWTKWLWLAMFCLDDQK